MIKSNIGTIEKPHSLRERQKIERRQKIILVTIELIAERGYENSHIDLIAERSNLSVPTIYRYFNTKRDIALAAIVAEVEDMRSVGRQLIYGDWTDPIEVFSQMIFNRVKNMLDEKHGNVTCQLWKITYSEAIRSPADDNFAERYYEIVTKDLNLQFIRLSELAKERRFFDSSINSDDVATLFMFMAHSLFRLWLLEQGRGRDEALALIRRQVSLIFNGLNVKHNT